MSHLQTSPPESALEVEPLVCFATIENALVAADLCSNEIEGLDETEAELLALLVPSDGDVFDVANCAKVVNTI